MPIKRELIILRHGKSDWSVGIDDFQRPVNERGQENAQQVGALLARKQWLPDTIISSPATRAMTTARLCALAMGLGADTVIARREIYEAGVAELIKVLSEVPENIHRVMMVGHNPGLEMLLLYLASKSVKPFDDGKILPTATLARMSISCNWSAIGKGCAVLKDHIRPSQLKGRYPYPFPDGSERRLRPAYYYHHVTVIPWRLNDGALEIMMLGLVQQKQWVLPVAICEPGLTPQQSMAKEIIDMAGIEGVIDDQPIGNYEYKRWGENCQAELYPMKVTKEYAADNHRESYQSRRWVSAQKAMVIVEEVALSKLIERFIELQALATTTIK